MLSEEENQIIYFLQDIYESLDNMGNRRAILEFYQSSKEDQLNMYNQWQIQKMVQKKNELEARKESLKKQLHDIDQELSQF